MTKVKDEFKVGKNNIGWVDPDFIKYSGDEELTKGRILVPQTLAKPMSDYNIEKELKIQEVTLGDILETIKKGDMLKSGYSNLFYTSSCLVHVYWYADDRKWHVNTWKRGGVRWSRGAQVFFPATETSETKPSEFLGSLTLEERVIKLEDTLKKIGELIK